MPDLTEQETLALADQVDTQWARRAAYELRRYYADEDDPLRREVYTKQLAFSRAVAPTRFVASVAPTPLICCSTMGRSSGCSPRGTAV